MNLSILLEQKIILKWNFTLTFKNVRDAWGEISIGVNTNCYEILDTSAKEFILTVIVKQRSNGWIKKVTATYEPNHMDRRGHFWMKFLRLVNGTSSHEWLEGTLTWWDLWRSIEGGPEYSRWRRFQRNHQWNRPNRNFLKRLTVYIVQHKGRSILS